MTGTTDVTFAGMPATTFTVVSATRLTAVVPPGASTGRIVLMTAGATAVSASEFVVGRPPDNDRFADALVLPGTDHYRIGRNVGAGKEAGEPDHAADPGGRSIWYRWTAPATGVWVFDTVGSDFDTLLAFYRGTSVNALTPVVENNDWSDDFSSRVQLEATDGTEYRIAVDGYAGDSGTVILRCYRQHPQPVLYATGFEEFNTASPLTGQRGWQSDGRRLEVAADPVGPGCRIDGNLNPNLGSNAHPHFRSWGWGD